jgi:purine-binding chemotaxis protein CheW
LPWFRAACTEQTRINDPNSAKSKLFVLHKTEKCTHLVQKCMIISTWNYLGALLLCIDNTGSARLQSEFHAMTIKETSIEALAFSLGAEEYGVDILKVQEIREHDAVTRIANAPDFIDGVVNLRGIIVPIVDLRQRFRLAPRQPGQPGVVIVLNIAGRIIGMVVDSVSDVLSLGAGEIRPAPRMGSALDTDFLLGIGTIDERMLILLDIERLMSSDELGLIERLAA